MPSFDPKAYLAEDDGPVQPRSAGAAPAFDPRAYLAEPDQAPAQDEDTRTRGEKFQDILFGNHPSPERQALDSRQFTPEQYAQYKQRLPAGLAGAAMMMLPTPASPLAAVGTFGAEGAAVGALEPADSSTQRLKNAALGGATAASIGGAAEGLAAGARYLWPTAKGVGAKIGEWVTGTPRTEIQTYGEQGPAIKAMMTQAGDSVPQAADTVREGWQKAIQDKKQALNQQISGALQSSSAAPSQSVKPILDALDAQAAKLHPRLQADSIAQINELKQIITDTADPKGLVNARDMNAIKQYLQERAGPSYMKAGQIFQNSKQAAQAAKGAGAQARGILNQMEPRVAQANNQLAALHDVDDVMNSNLIAPGKPDSAVMAAGSGQNQRNAMQLEQLGNLTGSDMKGDAQRLAAARTFSKPSWDPREANGAKVFRAGAGALLGGLTAHETGQPWEAGAIAGAALASPAALKLAIDGGRIPVVLAQKFGPGALAAISRSTPMIASGVVDANQPPPPAAPAQPSRQLATPAAPAKGEAAWAQKGASALGITDPAAAARLMQDPKARALLIQASGVSAGSKAMKAIQSKIQKGWGTP